MVKYIAVHYKMSIWYTLYDDLKNLPLNKFEVNLSVSAIWMQFILISVLRNFNLCMPSTQHMYIVIKYLQPILQFTTQKVKFELHMFTAYRCSLEMATWNTWRMLVLSPIFIVQFVGNNGYFCINIAQSI
jgi:hypothetical protein